MNTTIITTVNGVNIVELANQMIPIKPICEAIGIEFEPQRRKLQSDNILSSTATLEVSVGADNKNREMLCLPLKYVFGWLFTINPNNVKEEAKASVIQHQKECYDAIYDSLFLSRVYLKEMKERTEAKLQEIEVYKINFKEAQGKLKQSEGELKELRQFSFDDWKHVNLQTSMLDEPEFAN
ncbi:phage antirepressor N-terminal domain-containing protein [Myroides odoratus]|uniref:phage antirepressor N-terminal domain-containing protein n=1 Tax=Myroides odoratus TaxID=256 RepID=UPI00333F02A2